MTDSTIIYTHTDEAPLLATYSFLPIIAGVRRDRPASTVETRDISLAGPDHRRSSPSASTEEQRLDDALAELGELAKTPEANIIKLPNISASIPQLKAAIAELQSQGYDLPDYPDDPTTDEEQDVRARYDKVKGSAVNPVLREGNSDRRAPASVKQLRPQATRTRWAPGRADSKTNVAHMGADDFRSNEKSVVIAEPTARCASSSSATTAPPPCCKESVPVLAGEVVDATVHARRRAATSSSPRRSPGPRPRTCCSRCTSRPR